MSLFSVITVLLGFREGRRIAHFAWIGMAVLQALLMLFTVYLVS